MRLIDADRFGVISFQGKSEDFIEGAKYILEKIDEAPTLPNPCGKPCAFVRPHGEWIMHLDDLFPEESTEECSVCHEEQRITGNDDNFCPNCGADMRKEGDDNET